MNKEKIMEQIINPNTLNETEKKFEKICKDVLYEFETLETRHHDDLDFKDISVWSIRELMQKAYDLGKEDTLKGIK
ncbi:DUF6900 domain-containing protein [Ligilactobacillus ceti]|uniref:DUF6900 domain-containing protein n=1 Tax=Ligilactobacillus ceti DSM 22408 TaxID=1122146 RepID=A0A0R2KH59_9LACO|nr:hypothetical protein [Ligilactobacillus ceti]KRN88722.1 hypothetical protein IV53_GL000689 [Ligilactobacillus ceti DSM 22408]